MSMSSVTLLYQEFQDNQGHTQRDSASKDRTKHKQGFRAIVQLQNNFAGCAHRKRSKDGRDKWKGQADRGREKIHLS